METNDNQVTVTKRKTISQSLSGDTGLDTTTGKPYIFGVEVSMDDYMEYIKTPFRDQGEKIKEILSRY